MIRAVTANDASSICNIYNPYITDTVVTFEEEVITAADIAKRIAKVESEGLPWLVAEGDLGEILGYAYATTWRDRYSFRFTVEITAYLSTEHTSKGLGTQLYQALFDELKRKNIHCAIAGITLPNEASIALHEKFAMEKVAHFKEVGLKFNRWLDVGFWQKTL